MTEKQKFTKYIAEHMELGLQFVHLSHNKEAILKNRAKLSNQDFEESIFKELNGMVNAEIVPDPNFF